MPYDTPDYAAHRLLDTYIRDENDNLCRVLNCNYDRGEDPAPIVLRVEYLDGRRDTLRLDAVNIEPLPLGNINFVNERLYVVRMPMRNDWRQGARMRSMSYRSNDPYTRQAVMHNPTAFWKEVEKCVKLDYPPLFECQERVEDTFESAAFSRRFAVNEEGQLLYKFNQVVGDCEVEPRLDNDHVYLAEALEEDMRYVEL